MLINFEYVSTFKRLQDRTAAPGARVPRLNEDPRLCGELEEEDRLDLTLGCKRFLDSGADDVFDSMFDFIRKTSQPEMSLKETIDADIITNRQTLAHLALTRFPIHRNKCSIQAVRKNGVIFMKVILKTLKTFRYASQQFKTAYGGLSKFEQYMTLDENNEKHEKNATASNAERVKVVHRTTFSSETDRVTVYYASQADAIDSEGNFVKLALAPKTLKDWYRNSGFHSYLQSFFGNVPRMIVGLKTEDEQVYKIEHITREDILKKTKADSNASMKRVFEVLMQIKSKLLNDDEALLIQVSRNEIIYNSEDPKNCTFLDPQFFEFFQN